MRPRELLGSLTRQQRIALIAIIVMNAIIFIAAFVLLAAGLFSKSHRQPRQLQQGLPDPGLSDAQSGGFRQGDADEE